MQTDFGAVPISGFVARHDLPAWERCAKAKAQAAWTQGVECAPLTVDEAKTMPEWSPIRRITSGGWIEER